MRKTFIAGNWKMNLSKQEAAELASALADAIGESNNCLLYTSDAADE